ncbi:DUF11 domain-containing protein [Hymenobacter gummosus]|uniref:DUF11 domain-containing protein n=1 Tax=Hymenobacter gummosus TaxID=1776032 RepID=A0A431TXI7_9BACT|nr:Ig-like domain-containing protein [Hymenobacter gummosus]RTQ46337.1 DUF11 domain-containing protein [Hymenobacter gummosus]
MRQTLRLWTLLGAMISLGAATQAQAQCAASTLDFSTRNSGETWQSRTVAVPTGGTTISSGSYSPTSGNTVFDIDNINGARMMYWYNDYADGVGTNRTSSVTFTFSRAVSDLSLVVHDIDAAANFTDQVSFVGSGGVLPTLTLSGSGSGAPTVNSGTATVTGTANVTDNTQGSVTASFGSPVTSVTITYRNAANTDVPAGQAVGIGRISWCRALPVANDVTNSSTLQNTAAQTSINGLSSTVDGSVTRYNVTQLPSANEGILYYASSTTIFGTTYSPVQLSTDLTTSQAGSLRFDPAVSFAGGNATFRYTVTDNFNATSAPATFSIPIQAIALTSGASCGASYLDGSTHTGLTAEYYNGYFNDDMGFFASRTPALRRFDAHLDFTTNASWGSLVTAGAGTGSDANPENFSARYRGSIYIPNTGSYTFYLNSDDASYLWLDEAALAAVPTAASATINHGTAHNLSKKASASITLSAGMHNLLIFYGEGSTDNALTFTFAGPGTGGEQLVPTSYLCAGPGKLPPRANNVTSTLPAIGYALAPLSGTDADGSVASFTIETGPANGTLQLNGTPIAAYQSIPVAQAGNLTFVPNPGYAGTTSFTYHAYDNLGMRSATPATYTINAPNRAPLVGNDSRDVPLNTTVSGNVVLNDSDQEQNAFTVTLGTAPAHGTLTLNPNGTYSYTPNTGYTGPDSFTYTACDNATPSLCSGAATVSLRVFSTSTACTSATGTNLLQNPAFSSGNTGFTTNYRYVASGYVAGDGASGLYPEGTYAVGANASTFHPNFQGTGHTGGTGDNFLMVNGAASIRTLYSQTVTVQPGRYYTFSAFFNNLLAPGSNGGVPELGFVINGESVSGTIALNESPDQWVRFSDVWYSGSSTSATFEIRNVSTALGGNDLAVDDVYFGSCNLAPTAVADAATLSSGSSVTINVLSNDVDPESSFNAATIDLNPNQSGQQTTLSVTGGTFEVVSGQVRFTPTSGFVGTATASYTVQDTGGAPTNQANIVVTVPPTTADLALNLTAPASGATVTAGQSVTFTLTTTNNGAAAASGVAPTLQLPAGLTGPGTGGALTFSNGGNYDAATGLVTFPVTSLANAATLTNGVTFLAPGAGPISGAAGVTATTPDANTANNTASATINVAAGFDLTTAIGGPASAGTSTALTYTVVTRNAGPSAATGVTQTVSLPGNLTGLFVSNNGTYAYSAGTNTTVVTFPELSMLPAGQTVSNTITVPAPASAGTFAATASVAASGETTTSNNSASASTTVNATSGTPANLLVAVAATSNGSAVSSVAPGAPLTLTITATNAGPGPASGVVGRLALPAGLDPASLTISGGGSYDAATGVVTWNAGTLTAGTSLTATVQLAAPAYGPVLAAASLSSTSADAVMGDNAATAVVTINPTADVATSIVGPTTVTAGQRVSYTVTTRNNSGSTAYNVQQLVRLPPAVANLSYTSNLPAGTVDVQPNQTLLSYPVVSSLAPGQSFTNTITFDAPAAGSFQPLAYVTSGTADNVASNNTSALTVTTSRASDVTATVSGPSVVVSGTPVVYAIRTLNTGTSPAASVSTTVQLLTDLSGVVVRDEAGTVISGAYNASTGVVTFPTTTDMAVGLAGALTRTISFTAPDVAALNVTAVAGVSSTTNDLSRSNNTATFSTSVLRPTTAAQDLSVALSSGASQTAGQSLTYTLTTTNNSSTAATNVVQQVVLPAGLSGVTATNGGSYDPATGLVTFPVLSTLAGSGTQTNTITLTAPGAGPLTAVASVGSASSDGTPANNTAVSSVAITPVANVRTVVRSAGTALTGTALAGQPVTYLVRVLNDGPSPAANVGFRVQIPSGLSGVSAPGGSYDMGTGFVTYPAATSLPVGQEASLAYTITFAAPATSYGVTATATTSTTQSNSADDSQTYTTTLLNQAPVADMKQNALTAPDGNTATSPLPISPLSARDADGSIASFVLTALPASGQGTLFYAADGTNFSPVTLTNGRFSLPAANAGNLRFRPASGFVGNAFFSYLAVDASGAESAAVLYSLPVGADNAAVYTAAPAKGGTLENAYQTGDVITSVADANGAEYSFNSATTQTTVTDTGVRTATTDAAGTATLSGLGLALSPTTGAITVQNRTLLRAGSYSLSVTTVDEYGGVTTQTVPFSIGLGPLPVELVSFEAAARQQDALLTWRTAQEKNNERFDVERSLDGVTYEQVGELAGYGHSTTARQYRFVDAGAARPGQQLYYRLRQVDFDGTATTSEVRVVSFAKAATVELSLFPNPATDVVRVRLTGSTGAAQATLYSATGQLLRKQGFDAAQAATLDVQTLPAGTYLLRVQAADGTVYTQRLVKQ